MNNKRNIHHLEAIMRVLVYIEEHLDEPLELIDLAKIARISTFHFHRIFRATVGVTLQAYIKQLRLEAAEGYLRYSDKPITEIGLDLGYESHAAFTKMFKQLIGLSPVGYRTHMRPIVQTLIARTEPYQGFSPKYVTRPDEEVLFVRRTGDYKNAPEDAFIALFAFLRAEKQLQKVKAFYGIGLDDPQIVQPGKLRFDACASLHYKPKGEIGQKTLPGGLYACFVHKGPYSNLESYIVDIYRHWYTNSKKKLRDEQPIFEYPDISNDSISEDEQITYIYLPLQS